MKLGTVVSMMLVVGGLPSALARLPFESDFIPRFDPSLKDPLPSVPNSESNVTEKSAATTRAAAAVIEPSRRSVLNAHTSGTGNAGRS